MSTHDPIQLLFGGMHKLGPGDDTGTRHVLELLPSRDFDLVVDAGCGAGRQTLVLARELGTSVDALDLHRPFLQELSSRAREAGLDHLVRTHCMDMQEIPAKFREIDLLWSEGAAYSIGFGNALATWAPAIRPGGFLVVSELCWSGREVPERVESFFRTGYPDMRTVRESVELAEGAGYRLLGTHALPRGSWIEGYYEILAPRAQALVVHEDPAVREYAKETLEEIEVFEASQDSYGYVFLILQRGDTSR